MYWDIYKHCGQKADCYKYIIDICESNAKKKELN